MTGATQPRHILRAWRLESSQVHGVASWDSVVLLSGTKLATPIALHRLHEIEHTAMIRVRKLTQQ